MPRFHCNFFPLSTYFKYVVNTWVKSHLCLDVSLLFPVLFIRAPQWHFPLPCVMSILSHTNTLRLPETLLISVCRDPGTLEHYYGTTVCLFLSPGFVFTLLLVFWRLFQVSISVDLTHAQAWLTVLFKKTGLWSLFCNLLAFRKPGSVSLLFYNNKKEYFYSPTIKGCVFSDKRDSFRILNCPNVNIKRLFFSLHFKCSENEKTSR